MAIYQELINFDELITGLRTPPIILNDIYKEDGKIGVDIKDIIYSSFSSDIVSSIPSCECGATKGEFSIGLRCTVCNTEVRGHVEEDIKPLVWFRKPNDIEGLVNPTLWLMISKRFSKKGFSIIQWLTDTTYTPNKTIPKVISVLQENNIQRGYNFFVANFRYIMEVLFNLQGYRLPKAKRDFLYELVMDPKTMPFSNYLPLPNKSLLIVEKTNVGVYIDNTVAEAIDAVELLLSIDSKVKDYSTRVKENRLSKVMDKLAHYYQLFYTNILSQKEGIFRKHIMATRTHFCMRAVITSITDAHRYDELHIPWQSALVVLKFHLINKMMKLGMNYNECISYIYSKMYEYDPFLDRLFKEIIEESGEYGLPATIQRNPSLLISSFYAVGVTKVKTNPFDFTLQLSILTVKGPNADSRNS